MIFFVLNFPDFVLDFSLQLSYGGFHFVIVIKMAWASTMASVGIAEAVALFFGSGFLMNVMGIPVVRRLN